MHVHVLAEYFSSVGSCTTCPPELFYLNKKKTIPTNYECCYLTVLSCRALIDAVRAVTVVHQKARENRNKRFGGRHTWRVRRRSYPECS